MTPPPVPPPSAEPEVAQIRARLAFRIHGLANRGAEICPAYVLPVEGDVCCARCGYRDDVHLLRDALALVDQLQREQARLREDKEQACADSLGHQAAMDVALLEVERLTRELAEARDWSDMVTRGKSPCGHWKCYAHTEDGGKLIQCWQCRAEATEAKLTEAQLVQQAQRRKDFMAGWSAFSMLSEVTNGIRTWTFVPRTTDLGKEAFDAYLAQPPAPEPEKEQK